MSALKLVVVFLLIVLALRHKLSVGITLFGAGLVTAVLYKVSLSSLAQGYWELVKSQRFLSLTSVIVLITALGQLLKDLKFLERLAVACRGLPGGSRTAVAVMPPLVGLMPMPGGALLSAPLVGNVLTSPGYPSELKTVSNYWFRHVVEFFWPIYPGLILTEAITRLSIGRVSLMQFPLTVVMTMLGLVFFIRKIDNRHDGEPKLWPSIWGIMKTIWPIALAIALYGILKIELALAVLLAFVSLSIFARPRKEILLGAIRKALSYKLVFLVFGTLSFQTALELSGAVKSIPELSLALHLPKEVVIFSVCFGIGILTGMVAAYVGLGYSLLAGFLYQPQVVPSAILLAFFSGYLGMILSPTHLCLILSNEYFGSDLLKAYRLMAVPVILLAAFGLSLYFSPWASLFGPR
ncbi:MAG TPA: DUF401 family protein [Candidatus Deferrimicrobium sp.]|nr:DUF401 family protein [Candidatus Deferrimicrobium sp.]